MNGIDDKSPSEKEEKSVNFSEELSASGESNADTSTKKKKRKFRPAKIIAKLKPKKKNDSEETPQSDSGTSASSSKINSPKLSNLVKRFSGKKSYKVSPVLESSTIQEGLVKEFQKFSQSTPNVSGNFDDLNVAILEEFKSQPLLLDNITSKSPADTIDSKLTSENKKVQLKITISGKLINSSDSHKEIPDSGRIIDKASSPTSTIQEQKHADIILPTVNTQMRLSTTRDEFFNVARNNAKTLQSISSTIYNTQSAAVVEEGHSQVDEVDKYLSITSSLNSIISAANELNELSKVNFPELKIREEDDDKEEEEEMRKSPKSKIPVTLRRSLTSESVDQPTVHTQEATRPNQLNLSSSPSPTPDDAKNQSELKPSEINFELGTPVRPLRIIQATNNNFTPLIITELEQQSASQQPPNQDSNDEIFHSPKSEASIPINGEGDKLRSSTRRKIAYIPELTQYTAEEQELLKSNIIANSDSADIPSLSSMPDSSIFPNFDNVLVRMQLRNLFNFLLGGY